MVEAAPKVAIVALVLLAGLAGCFSGPEKSMPRLAPPVAYSPGPDQCFDTTSGQEVAPVDSDPMLAVHGLSRRQESLLLDIEVCSTYAGTVDGPAHAISLSANGRYAAYVTTASTLIQGHGADQDATGRSAIIIWDLAAGRVVHRIYGLNGTGERVRGCFQSPALSADGLTIAYSACRVDMACCGDGLVVVEAWAEGQLREFRPTRGCHYWDVTLAADGSRFVALHACPALGRGGVPTTHSNVEQVRIADGHRFSSALEDNERVTALDSSARLRIHGVALDSGSNVTAAFLAGTQYLPVCPGHEARFSEINSLSISANGIFLAFSARSRASGLHEVVRATTRGPECQFLDGFKVHGVGDDGTVLLQNASLVLWPAAGNAQRLSTPAEARLAAATPGLERVSVVLPRSIVAMDLARNETVRIDQPSDAAVRTCVTFVANGASQQRCTASFVGTGRRTVEVAAMGLDGGGEIRIVASQGRRGATTLEGSVPPGAAEGPVDVAFA